MNFFEILYNIIISPLEMIIETVFCFELIKIGIFGAAGAIVAVSLAVGFLTLPIYNVADAIQKRESGIQHGMASGIKRIKDTFTGDERFMMMQTFYREHHWSPVYALRSSLSIIIEVPFFIAAYHFLSHCSALQGVSCGILRDLGKPDGLIAISAGGGRSLAFNLLPILMTAINAVSSAIYLKGFSVREKAQTYCLALIFLVLLYNSPSGLVLYWTLNNLFSLAKNAVQRWVKEPWRVVHGVIALAMAGASVYTLLFKDAEKRSALKWGIMLLVSIVFAVAPYVVRLLRPVMRSSKATATHNNNVFPMFLFSAVGLALLCGMVLPASVVATSPEEFSFIGEMSNPLYYVTRNLCVFAGLFVLWPLVIYFMLDSDTGDGHTQDKGRKLDVSHNKKMFGDKVKRVMPNLFAFALVMALFDVYVTGYKYGTLNCFLELTNPEVLRVYSPLYTVVPIAAAALCIALLMIAKHFGAMIYVSNIVAAICIAEFALGAIKMHTINDSYKKYAATASPLTQDTTGKVEPIYHLSKTGKNVVVLFLDRAMSSFFPYVVRQFPHLAEDFDGFVYYPNTVSFSVGTLKATPAMMGGYEYTPENENKRPDVLLKDKHNEAMLLAPRLFSEAGWSVLVTNPPFSNYKWGSDVTPFLPYPDISCRLVEDNYADRYMIIASGAKGDLGEASKKIITSHMPMYCVMVSFPPVLRSMIYNSGNYLQSTKKYHWHCIKQFSHMYYLPDITDCSAAKNTYTFISNDLTHQPQILKEPDYIPSDDVREEDATCGYYKWKLSPSDVGESSDLLHYHVNAAAMLQTARWLDKLRELGCYDNTRIIIVADHGNSIPTPLFDVMDEKAALTCAAFNPLFMMKDFDAHGAVMTDNAFMTNADTILLAKQGLGISDINPFTGKNIMDYVDKKEVHIYPDADSWAFNENPSAHTDKTLWLNGKECHPLAVHDNIFDKSNWTPIGGK